MLSRNAIQKQLNAEWLIFSEGDDDIIRMRLLSNQNASSMVIVVVDSECTMHTIISYILRLKW